ncbi:ribonuclease P protein component [Candidatus Parcubacteria bacterium]|nr:ribonuclease P protein component [Candidatus Parcubacteria bacterium]
MLAKINRLTKDKDFDNVFKNGKSSYDKIIGVKAAASQQKNSRFGILVSAKVSKKAVERNAIKRKIREALKPRIIKIAKNYDIVIVTFPGILGKSYQDVEQSIIRHFQRLGLHKLNRN